MCILLNKIQHLCVLKQFFTILNRCSLFERFFMAKGIQRKKRLYHSCLFFSTRFDRNYHWVNNGSKILFSLAIPLRPYG